MATRKATVKKNRQRDIRFAEQSEVAEFAASLSEKFLLCREMGHNWRPWAAQWVPEDQYFERILRCTRCRTQRHQALSNTGAVLTSNYEYAEGYQNKGFGRITGEGRDRLRLESVTRAIGDKDQIEE